MKSIPMLLIICFLAVGIFLFGTGCTGCEDPPPPPPPPSPPSPPPSPPPPLPSDPYDGFMTAEESEKWLRNNHYQVRKKADGNGYIITRNYYDPDTKTRDNSRYDLSDRAMVGFSGVLITIDEQGRLRVSASGTQQ